MSIKTIKPFIKSRPFGTLADGREVKLFELSNSNNIKVRVLNYGGIIQSIEMPDREGKISDIVLGFDDLKGYENDTAYHGALVGRYANRIAGAKFTVNGREHNLAKNDGDNCLHGGSVGFNRALWEASILITSENETLRLTHVSLDGDQGFPGELRVTADFTLSPANELRLQLSATCDQSTAVSLTTHPYFNLSGDAQNTVLDHSLILQADEFLPVISTMNPTGAFSPVEDTPFDFRKARKLGSKFRVEDDQLKMAAGYDHCYVQRVNGAPVACFAKLSHAGSGRVLKIRSNAPGLQLYTGNYLDSKTIGKAGKPFTKTGGVCLEPQEFPNAPNQPEFGFRKLNSGELYQHSICFQFSVKS